MKIPSSGYNSNPTMGKSDKDTGRGNTRIKILKESTKVGTVVIRIPKSLLYFSRQQGIIFQEKSIFILSSTRTQRLTYASNVSDKTQPTRKFNSAHSDILSLSLYVSTALWTLAAF
jgi:hypothetical protein